MAHSKRASKDLYAGANRIESSESNRYSEGSDQRRSTYSNPQVERISRDSLEKGHHHKNETNIKSTNDKKTSSSSSSSRRSRSSSSIVQKKSDLSKSSRLSNRLSNKISRSSKKNSSGSKKVISKTSSSSSTSGERSVVAHNVVTADLRKISSNSLEQRTVLQRDRSGSVLRGDRSGSVLHGDRSGSVLHGDRSGSVLRGDSYLETITTGYYDERMVSKPREYTESHIVYDGHYDNTRKYSRVIKGEPRVIHHASNPIEGETRILKEYTIVDHVEVPTTVVREDIIEKKLVVPDYEDERIVSEHRTAKRPRTYRTVVKKVEVPEEHIIYTDIEVPTPSGNVIKEPVYVTKKVTKPRICRIVEERLVEQVIEEEEIQYNDIEQVTEVEIPQIVQITKYNDIPTPTIVDRPIEVVEEIIKDREIDMIRPVGVEAVTRVKYTVPRIKEVVTATPYKIYVPRFIEIPTNSVQLSPEFLKSSLEVKAKIENMGSSICAAEQVALEANDNYSAIQGYLDQNDLQSALIKNFAI